MFFFLSKVVGVWLRRKSEAVCWLAAALIFGALMFEMGVAAEMLEPIPADSSYFADEKPVAPERDLARENRRVFSDRTEKNPSSSTLNRQSAADFSARGERQQSDSTANTRRNPAFYSVPMILLVLVLLGALGFMGYRFYRQNGSQLFSAPVLEILARTQVDRQKHFSLLRVGKRLLVVGVTTDGFSLLAEITDPQEAAEVMLEARPKTAAGKNMFLEMFKRHIADEQTPLPDAPDAGEEILRRQVKKLREKEK